MEGVRLSRWLLDPFSTAVIARQMKRKVYKQGLTQRYGRLWRWKAPTEELLPVRLARFGLTVDEALQVPGKEAVAAAVREHEAGVRTRELALRLEEERATAALAEAERKAGIETARARAEAARLHAEAEVLRAQEEARTAAEAVVRKAELDALVATAEAEAIAEKLRAAATAEADRIQAEAAEAAEAKRVEAEARTAKSQVTAEAEARKAAAEAGGAHVTRAGDVAYAVALLISSAVLRPRGVQQLDQSQGGRDHLGPGATCYQATEPKSCGHWPNSRRPKPFVGRPRTFVRHPQWRRKRP